MKSFLKVTAAAALLALAFAPGRAWALTGATTTLPVSASVTSGCLIGASGLNFGGVSPLILEEDTVTGYTATGTVFIACGTEGPTSGSYIAVTLDDGANSAIAPILGIGTGSGTPLATRAMTNSTSFLAYDLFEPSLIYGSGTVTSNLYASEFPVWTSSNTQFGTFTITWAQYNSMVAIGSAAIYLPVYGSIPGDQVQPLTAGVYTDTVNVSVSF